MSNTKENKFESVDKNKQDEISSKGQEAESKNPTSEVYEKDTENNPETKLNVKERNLTANPGDRISGEPQTIEEKSKQIAVDVPDITGDHIKVPTYFIVKEPDGEEKALHHVKDAEEISDVIRQARMDENGNRIWD